MNCKLNEDELGFSDLQRAGIPLDKGILDGIKAASQGLSVFQTGSLVENTVFDLDSGGSGYMLSVAIHNDSNRPVRLHEFRLKLLWNEAQFRWLSDPFRALPRKYAYSFPGRRSIEFEREAVLNHHLCNAGKLNPGGSCEGLLLGMGDAPIPPEYQKRQALKTSLFVFDSQGRHSVSSFQLCVERTRSNRAEKKTSRVSI
jgi:hypothetical protein